jgi:hypothetical protein
MTMHFAGAHTCIHSTLQKGMNKKELSYMMKANLGDQGAKHWLVKKYKKKIILNDIVFLVLAAGFFYFISLGALFVFAVLFVVGNRICLRNQLKRIKEIRTDRGHLGGLPLPN